MMNADVNKSDQAYPRAGYMLANQGEWHRDGMTKEEVFIMAAMQGILSNPTIVMSAKEVSGLAHEIGSRTLALITEVNNTKEKLS